MARITIVHTTEYTYRNPVGLTRHQMIIRPDDSHDLRLHQATLAVDPAPSKTRWAHDVFNNSICFLEWPKTLRTKHLVTRTAEQALPISGGYLGDPNDPIGLDVCVAVSAVPIMEGVEPVAG